MQNWRVNIAVFMIKLLSRPAAKDFAKQLLSPEKAQQKIFCEIKKNLAKSQYGQALGVNEDITYSAFRRTVPIVSYDNIAPWIEKEKQGFQGILTPHHIDFFEKTSGSGGPAKYIAYNKPLLNSFNRMFKIWVHDILTNGIRVETSRIFMSISPALRDEKQTIGGTPIGLDDDSQYLKKMWGRFLKPFLITPPLILDIENIEDFRYLLAATLLAEENLEMISIWNPTYFLVLLETISIYREDLIHDLAMGFIVKNGTRYVFRALSAERKALLQKPAIHWQALWPKLKLISCWTKSMASYGAQKLNHLFPDVLIQGKGLLATEAPISIPLMNSVGCAPMLNEVFFEFRDSASNIYLLHQVSVGETYELIISQRGGLYRYCLGDRIKVTGKYHNTPCFEFVGRTNHTCDMVGEKLTEDFVLEALNQVIQFNRVFCMLIPRIETDGRGYYVLVCEKSDFISDEALDETLSKSYHYQNSRILGQLKKPVVMVVPNMQREVQDFMILCGKKWGNIKDKILITDFEMAKRLLDHLSNEYIV